MELDLFTLSLAASQVIITLFSALCAHIHYGCLGITNVHCLDKDLWARRDAMETNGPAIASVTPCS